MRLLVPALSTPARVVVIEVPADACRIHVRSKGAGAWALAGRHERIDVAIEERASEDRRRDGVGVESVHHAHRKATSVPTRGSVEVQQIS